jgi:hypothetical protein
MSTQEETLNSAATAPKAVEVDGQRMESHSLRDQIEMDRYMASKAAMKRRGLGLRMTKIISGGAV